MLVASGVLLGSPYGEWMHLRVWGCAAPAQLLLFGLLRPQSAAESPSVSPTLLLHCWLEEPVAGCFGFVQRTVITPGAVLCPN